MSVGRTRTLVTLTLLAPVVGHGPVSAHPGDDVAHAEPDVVADAVGGIAARVRTADGSPVPGDVYVLMAAAGSTAPARVYDETAYIPPEIGNHDDTLESNRAARAVVESVLDRAVRSRDFTAAPAGGPSGGLTYAIAYLDLVTGGGFTGDLAVAATGELIDGGYVQRVDAIDEKVSAATAARLDVVFTSSLPSEHAPVPPGGRVVGAVNRARNTDRTLSDERLWVHYRRWGATRPVGAPDIVGVQHVGDVAAYLCGAGCETACTVLDRFATGDLTGGQATTWTDGPPEFAGGSGAVWVVPAPSAVPPDVRRR